MTKKNLWGAVIYLMTLGILLLLNSTIVKAQDIDLDNQVGFFKEEALFTISIAKAPKAVKSFGFELYFDPKVLEYSEYQRCGLLENFDYFECRETEPGVLRCGGFEVDGEGISKGQTGEMLVVHFRKKECRNTMLGLSKLVDDLQEWTPGSGRFFCLGK